ncbi:putative polyketide beta-ketoacyl synthase 1 [Ktedonobacter sp. SOSP1-52]|uniref:beta-ketoacyl-[acyl-carrier-protein] synthase family protein n=1 Tax=Ktedonobacter sp. SOSP1-52 TaxID=2778366 RepID=UPI00191529D8|nr:beta-ketoacyl-[acyl-carrier-protein] synthase family protein [Ktedonobacter sp. SOSP1-52]GHO65470.1 putative polyketide beta-ketoacyl synthase 1 [Ktedonobacter sp. SOSP1-52]
MRRVVITGIGVVAPGGTGREAFWETLKTGTSACDIADMDHLENFRSRVVGAVTDWTPLAYGLTEEEVGRLDRHIQFALVATAEALQDSCLNLSTLDPTLLGVSAGTAIGSTTRLEQEYLAVSQNATEFNVDPTLASPYLYHAVTPSSLSAELATRYNARGTVITVSSGCTAGIDAIAQAFEWIRDGDVNVCIAGASEAGICPINMASFDAIKGTTPRNDEPKTASRPFDKTRNGFVLGEGGAFLILEDLAHASQRGAHIYAEITGYGSALNAHHMTGLQRHGLDMAQAIHAAFESGGIAPDSVQYINAHGSSTPQNDVHETNAFKAAWGPQAYRIPISSIKSMVGHSLGAIGAVEIAACALIIQRGIIPPTINYRTPDPDCDLDYVPNTARQQTVDVIVSTGSGFGGFQSALILSRAKEELDA